MSEIDQSVDMIPRRMVMRQKVWAELVELAKAMSEKRGHDVTPNDVAVMAIEAGVGKVEKSVKRRKAKP